MVSKHDKEIAKKGFVLIISVLTLTTLLIAGSYLLTTANSESKISTAQSTATKNYYIAEAGIHDMVWNIQNNASTRDAFLAGTLNSSHNISKTNIFGNISSSYEVSAINTVATEAWITSTSTYQIGDSISQRVIKSYVTKPTGSGANWDFSTFAGGKGGQQNGNFTFTGSGTVLTANGGRLHANQVFKIQGANVTVNDGAVSSSNVINTAAGGTLTLNGTSYQDSPTSTVDMLQIDFNSSDSNSWKNRATVIYSENDFENLPNGTTLSGIIYIDGEASIKNKNMTIDGVLIAADDIEIDLSNETLIITSNATYGGGLLSKKDVEIKTSGGAVTIDGLIYAGDDLDMDSSNTTFTINGSMAGFDARLSASGQSITLNYVPENFVQVINPIFNPNAPIIQIDHWEEQY